MMLNFSEYLSEIHQIGIWEINAVYLAGRYPKEILKERGIFRHDKFMICTKIDYVRGFKIYGKIIEYGKIGEEQEIFGHTWTRVNAEDVATVFPELRGYFLSKKTNIV